MELSRQTFVIENLNIHSLYHRPTKNVLPKPQAPNIHSIAMITLDRMTKTPVKKVSQYYRVTHPVTQIKSY